MKLSVISPVYRAEKIIPVLVERIEQAVSVITSEYEIILVEDSGPDQSWAVIEQIAQTNERVIGLKLSRNFGQHYAISAGLDKATGDWIVVMDCDLQDRPEEIPNLYKKAQEGYDVVLAERYERQDTFIKRLTSATFYKVLSYLTGTKQDKGVANFGIYSKAVIKAVCSMREPIRYFPTMIKWVGFKQTKLPVEHNSRFEGKTTYNYKKLLNLALDIILAYSDKPVRLTVKVGLIISLMAILAAFYTLIMWITGNIAVMGYTSLIISIWFLSGIIILTLGIVGLYVGKTFEGVKSRPIYIIDKIVNGENTH
ncbi:glycosyltransferase involved in cell wall biosynthesis [Dysgonomonas sp. PFB1-18]|uniref:glycosyltransferase family 2 protein n=1 Tax=unclassified Dysgonomonas TaxID=2630389 RepID=UPI002474593E|nr:MULTISPECIES: glycosyltransferase family 2 protein [unclassified Dysgonomonas]MDH6308487.1 glycosyltransferase involved in cell wall biosynthesis [Dysgonomonas sp. PF1-14]MDH6337988.1 glycosyltransferase involved in cell wall biosynthesis [Dysgonomonas sp. PF1-16]MDH6379485.1 glycosyltransferase involved in cell wall biosynthesis [Dysgonomonas sp. PFB1-18]MDH6396816.1 glycosyltransferase involved in cell wall biosynthesis [Dysgonomonas sp. PF1-23]